MTFLVAKTREELRKKLGLYCREKIIQKAEWIAKSFELYCANRAVPAPRGRDTKIRG